MNDFFHQSPSLWSSVIPLCLCGGTLSSPLRHRGPQSFTERSLLPSSQSQSQRVQFNEALSVTLVVDRVCLERRDALVIQRIRRTPADDDYIAAIKLQSHV